ncbi:MAG: hypothetical protein ACI8QS_003748 [Planctomycetota bacterium]
MSNRRLYTEDSVRALRPGSEIILGGDAMATPAALDLAFVRGVRVRWDDGSAANSGCDCTSEQAQTWKHMLENDGEYVVKVQDGQARVFRLTPDGPVLCP